MWKSLIIGSLLSIFSFNTNSQQLTNEEIKKEIAIVSLFYIDCSQTKDIKNHINLKESNPILGSHPSNVRINNYFIVSGISHVVILTLLPPDWRPIYQNSTIALEVVVIGRNKFLGLKTQF